jgi:hypothetical protein
MARTSDALDCRLAICVLVLYGTYSGTKGEKKLDVSTRSVSTRNDSGPMIRDRLSSAEQLAQRSRFDLFTMALQLGDGLDRLKLSS